ncbi:hypothetical protein GGD56_006234 [Rhizobium mongolense]|uniref:Uncharacterized protein n=1 Tax=Rhizobium mongolense TaxID=57676 RepID=A0ABR6IXS6_9HYPH|nr:hypothetical protein [Rhizobium mongolense]
MSSYDDIQTATVIRYPYSGVERPARIGRLPLA